MTVANRLRDFRDCQRAEITWGASYWLAGGVVEARQPVAA